MRRFSGKIGSSLETTLNSIMPAASSLIAGLSLVNAVCSHVTLP